MDARADRRTAPAPEEAAGERIDKWLPLLCEGVSRSMAQKLLEGGGVFVDGRPVSDKNYRLRGGETITVELPQAKPADLQPEPIALEIVYEDDDLVVVNKPQGMVVHPAAGNPDGTLVNALLYHCGASLSGIGGVARPGIVHRIDKDTSGLLLVAKNDHAHRCLAGQIKEHSLTRIYEAMVHGNLKNDEGVIDAPIGRHPANRKKMAVRETHSRTAVTHYRVLERYGRFTHLQLRLETGRTHQIRVHMAAIGHPVAGDRLYGPQKPAPGLKGQCLHARTIGFCHPSSGEYMEFSSPLPEYFTKFLDIIAASSHQNMLKNTEY